MINIFDTWRRDVKLRTGWSDEIISALRSKEEAQIGLTDTIDRLDDRPC